MADHDITLTVNGTEESLTVESRTLLVHALRDDLDYTAPNVGCESGKCGACTVSLDGDAVKSCLVLAVEADGSEVLTAAALADQAPEAGGTVEATGTAETGGTGETLHPIQTAFHEEHGLQCGYCTPGMLMTTRELLAENPDPTRAEVRAALKGNICRCTGYAKVVDAVETAAERAPEGD